MKVDDVNTVSKLINRFAWTAGVIQDMHQVEIYIDGKNHNNDEILLAAVEEAVQHVYHQRLLSIREELLGFGIEMEMPAAASSTPSDDDWLG